MGLFYASGHCWLQVERTLFTSPMAANQLREKNLHIWFFLQFAYMIHLNVFIRVWSVGRVSFPCLNRLNMFIYLWFRLEIIGQGPDLLAPKKKMHKKFPLWSLNDLIDCSHSCWMYYPMWLSLFEALFDSLWLNVLLDPFIVFDRDSFVIQITLNCNSVKKYYPNLILNLAKFRSKHNTN